MAAVREKYPDARFERVMLDGQVDILVKDSPEEVEVWNKLNE